jgi:hypothetical protein
MMNGDDDGGANDNDDDCVMVMAAVTSMKKELTTSISLFFCSFFSLFLSLRRSSLIILSFLNCPCASFTAVGQITETGDKLKQTNYSGNNPKNTENRKKTILAILAIHGD